MDGDTLHIEPSQRLRLAMVNTPELGRNGQPSQPLAEAATKAVMAFMQADQTVFWQIGLDSHQRPMRDHYGRWLGQVYNAQGDWLAAQLVAQGLAFVISIPPLVAPSCLWRLEDQAKLAGKGIWATRLGRPLPAASIKPAQGGFMLISGRVMKITQSKHNWYMELDGDVVLRFNKKRWAVAGGSEPRVWLDQQVWVRGWLVWRQLSAQQRLRGFKSGLMNISHPHMLTYQGS